MTDRETWAEQRERLVAMTTSEGLFSYENDAARAALERIDALEEAVATKDRALSAAVDELREAKTQHEAALAVVEAARGEVDASCGECCGHGTLRLMPQNISAQCGSCRRWRDRRIGSALARFDALHGGQ